MRTVSFRLSPPEDRLLRALAGARGVSVETLVREALAFPPIQLPHSPVRRLEVVRGGESHRRDEQRSGPLGPVS
jgi:hypothetical protein